MKNLQLSLTEKTLKTTQTKICENNPDCPLVNEIEIPYEGEGDTYIVGMAGADIEAKKGRPFVGRSGQLLRNTLKKLNTNEYRLGNVCRCYVKAGEKLPPEAKEICKQYLFEDIKQYKPKVIIGLGDEVVNTFYPFISKISDFVGQVWYHKEFDCLFIPCFHPSYILRKKDKGLFSRFIRTLSLLKRDLQKPIFRVPEIKKLTTQDQVKHYLLYILNNIKVCAFDFETTSQKPYDGDIHTISFAYNNICFSFPCFLINDEINNILKQIWLHENILKIAHNLLFEAEWIYQKFGIVIRNAIDTMIMNFALYGGHLESHGLKLLARTRLGVDDWAIETKHITDLPLDKVLEYNALDSFYTLLLYENFERDYKYFKENKQYKPNCMRLKYRNLCNKILFPMIPYISKAIVDGIPVSYKQLDTLETNLVTEVRKLTKKIYTNKFLLEYHKPTRKIIEMMQLYSPDDWDLVLAKTLGFIEDKKLNKENKKVKKELFNVNSTKQLADFLLHLGCELPKTKKGNLSVNETVLKSLETTVPIVKYYLQLRKILKKLSTYVTKSRALIFKDGKFHPNFVLIGNDTSRFMANKPNCLNFPKNAGKEIRDIISAPDGCVMITADFKNLEVRGEGIFSGDEELTKIILNNFDMHNQWSERLFGKSKAEEYRHKAKNGFVFPILYGAGVKTLCQGVGWGLTEQNLKKMTKIRNEFWQMHPRIKIRHENMIADYEHYGEIYDMCGRFRSAPIERGEGNNKLLNYNAIINYQIQSSCFYFTMNAWFYLLKKGYWTPFELHDELIVFTRETEKDITLTVKDIHYAMTELNHKTFSIFKKTPIRLECDMKIGKSFGNLVDFDFEKYLKENITYSKQF